MGEIIQIRVMAKTHDPEEAKNRWIDLVSLAFDTEMLPSKTGEDFHAQLVDALNDRLRLGKLPAAMSSKLKEDIHAALEQKNALLEALSDWNPRAADKAAYALEDILDEMQQKIAR